MPYRLALSSSRDKFVQSVFKRSMKELGEFYDINWTTNLPKIFLLKTREEIDLFHTKPTEPWLVAWADERFRAVFILGRKSLERESSHKYSEEYYSSLIKHELSHLFYKIRSYGRTGPAWLSEGVAIYTSGQNRFKPVPNKLENFLEFYKNAGSGVYSESGFVVEALIREFGKKNYSNFWIICQRSPARTISRKLLKRYMGSIPPMVRLTKYLKSIALTYSNDRY